MVLPSLIVLEPLRLDARAAVVGIEPCQIRIPIEHIILCALNTEEQANASLCVSLYVSLCYMCPYVCLYVCPYMLHINLCALNTEEQANPAADAGEVLCVLICVLMCVFLSNTSTSAL